MSRTLVVADRNALVWPLALVCAFGVQCLGVWYSEGDLQIQHIASVQAYLVAFLAVLLLADDSAVTPVRSKEADPRLRDWIRGSSALFQSTRFRSLVPGAGIMLASGAMIASGEIFFALRDASEAERVLLPLLASVQLLQPLLLWGVTTVLLGLSLLMIEAEADLRFLGALVGYSYAPLPLVAGLLLGYQLLWLPEATSGTDPRLLLPSVLALKFVEVWAVVTMARGLSATPRRGRSRSLYASLAIAAIPYAALTLAKLVFGLALA